MRWTVVQAADALGVPVPAGLGPMAGLAGVSIDSRTVKPGELFIAIHGPRHDGHAFVAAALAAGAKAGLVARARYAEYPAEIQGRLFAVDDPLGALQRMAARACEIWRTGKPGRLVGAVAGSVGKTTTKEILAAVVGSRFRVLKTQGNLNNEYGLPLTLLRLDEDYEAAIVELGMSHSGELARLAQIASPDVGVITRVAVEHLEFFSSLDEIALAERELIENLAWPAATAVLNADDERVARFAEVARGRVATFGTNSRADFRAGKIEDRGLEGSAFDFVSSGRGARMELPLIGRHNVMNALGALAAASVWGINAVEAQGALAALKPADKRGEVVRFDDGFTVINDSYNSSPSALGAMVELLAATPGYKRRILAAGEMLELGESSAELHRECGRAAAKQRGIDWIVGVRGNAAELVRAAIKAGHPEQQTRYFEDSDQAAAFLKGFILPGDLLLLKGSRGVRMERVLESIETERRRRDAEGRVNPGADTISAADARTRRG
ncbi:MAG TPA: UDP-N-acetylmuramoyl-tripeptide--D-alanyl-D-alanine ligase [Candidatus Acidoferrales bacterium]|nr:UDP-N-acetylmuramoyl-tripeptide--D-alanyl-D-alanine ligase [Candidatus Acidoferrales bacterium]